MIRIRFDRDAGASGAVRCDADGGDLRAPVQVTLTATDIAELRRAQTNGGSDAVEVVLDRIAARSNAPDERAARKQMMDAIADAPWSTK